MKMKAEVIIGGIGVLILVGTFLVFLSGKNEPKPETGTGVSAANANTVWVIRDKMIAERAAKLEKDGYIADPYDIMGINPDTGQGAAVDLSQIVKAEGEQERITLGIDVSKYQGTIDWKQVAEAGIEYAMIRVGYRSMTDGKIAADPNARYNMQEAAKYNIPIGVYFFSTAVSEAEALEEAGWVADFISRYPITYPVAYNCEGYGSSASRQ